MWQLRQKMFLLLEHLHIQQHRKYNAVTADFSAVKTASVIFLRFFKKLTHKMILEREKNI